jgi:hypothetical protein
VTRRLVILVCIGAAAAVLLVVIGRAEAGHHARVESRQMRAVVATIGQLDNSTLDAYRVLPIFDCLLYKRGANPFALEVCVARDGRVIETIDRRSGDPRVASLREDPRASTVRVGRAEVERLIRRMGATP